MEVQKTQVHHGMNRLCCEFESRLAEFQNQPSLVFGPSIDGEDTVATASPLLASNGDDVCIV